MQPDRPTPASTRDRHPERRREAAAGRAPTTARLPRGLERFEAIASASEPLARHTTLGTGGRCAWFFTPRDIGETAALFEALDRGGVPAFILGGGSNLLVKDQGFDGAVVNLSAMAKVQVAGERIRAAAGAPLAKVAKRAMSAALSGMEGLVGIPGTLGGAVFMNAGGRHGETGDVVESVRVLDRRGRLHTLAREQVGFRYRGTDLGPLVVCEVTLRLRPGKRGVICHRMGEVLKKKHLTQPMGERSSGCVFKNPAPESAAARLIDEAGLKGARVGGAEVSTKHANFIVNTGGATSADVLALVGRVRREVLVRAGRALCLEVQVLGAGGLERA